MSGAADAAGVVRRPVEQAAHVRIALLGTGTVGRAVLERLAAWKGTSSAARASLVYAANSRVAVFGERLCPRATLALARGGQCRVPEARASVGEATRARGVASLAAPHSPMGHPPPREDACNVSRPRELRTGASELDHVPVALLGPDPRILIDATSSEAVAERHAGWLAQGIHVVTACKLGQGGSLARWHAIRAAQAQGGTQYGDSATVGAGLPLLRSLRELQAGGDRIHSIAGVLSGSLAWLFDRYDGMRPFSDFVREARTAGYTEPDPRDDLSGEDVRRKLLILARAAGAALEADEVEVESLVPAALAQVPLAGLDGALERLDAPLRERFAAAHRNREKLRFIARLDADGARPRARVGLESLAADDPLAGGAGTDNRVAIRSDRYAGQPLVIQGPGAGAGVTAAALLDDALRIAASA